MKKLAFSRKQLLLPYALFLALFVIIPLFIVVYYAFTDKNGLFTFANFTNFFSDPTAITTILSSLGIAFATTALCLMLAYPVAYILARSSLKKKNILLMIFIMPMWINFVLRINALKELLQILKLLGKANYFNTILGMVYDFLPFMILPIFTTLIKLDKSLIEASSDLGAGKLQTFLKVTLPLSMPGIASGVIMVFMPTMTVFVISETLGNGLVPIIGKLIDDNFNSLYNWNMGAAIALILLLIIFISMLFTGRFKDENLENKGQNLW